MGFISNRLDNCVYVMKSGSSFIIFPLYVDDILLATNDMELLNKVKIELSEKFEMKDKGEAFYVFGIQILRDQKSRLLSINQEKYLHLVLKRFEM